MKRKAISGIVLMLLLTSMLSSTFIIQPVKAAGETIYIRADGSVDPSTASIQRDGDVYTFTDNIYDNSIVIERDNIVLDGNGYALQGATGFTLYCGIDLSGRSNVTVRNILSINRFRYGIFLNCSNGNLLANNTVTRNSLYGIYLYRSSTNMITNNIVSSNMGGGIYLGESSENGVINNDILWNGYGYYGTWIARIGVYLDYSNSNIVSENVMTGNAGIQLINSSDNNIARNSMKRRDYIYLLYSSNNNIIGNDITDTSYGIYLHSSSDNTIIGNNITKNKYGVYFEHSSRNILSQNNVANSKYGIHLSYSSTNTLYDNLLDGNEFGLIVFGLTVSDYLHSIDTSNRIDGKPIYYLVDQHDLIVNPLTYPQIGYLALINCTNIRVENIDYGNQYYGLLIVNTNDSQIINNNVTNNYAAGFVLLYSAGNIISGNNVANSGGGIYLRESDSNNVSGNTITNSSIGVSLYYSPRNTIIGNDIKASKYGGIRLSESSNNFLSSNTIANNGGFGIDLSLSFNNTITNNDIIDNDGVGIYTYEWRYYTLGGAGRNHTITNNNITGNKRSRYREGGICLNRIYDSTISGNIVSNNDGYGVCLERCGSNTISSNVITNNSRDGISFSHMSYNVLSDNLVTNNDGYGVYLARSAYNTLSGNVMAGNRYNFGFYVASGHPAGLINYVDSSNTVDGKPIYYWIDERDKVVPSDAGCVIIIDSMNITIKDATLTRNDAGVFLAFTTNSIIQNITSTDNYYGVTLLGSRNNNITGNTIANNEYVGVYLYQGSSRNTITENNIKGNFGGFSLFKSGDNIISGNVIANSDGYGISFSKSSNNLLSANTIADNEVGVSIGSSYNNALYDNLLNDNQYGLSVSGESLDHYLHSIDTSNFINGNPVYYWVNQQNKEVPSNAGYIAIVNSTRITVKGQTLTSNGQGVLIAFTKNSRIVNNTIATNSWGIYLYGSYGNIITGNIIINNVHGVYLRYSSKNTMTRNNITNNLYGVYLYSSSNNLLSDNTIANSIYYGIHLYGSSDNNIYHNNFIDNSKQASGYGSKNVWDDGYPSGGNYWSDYTGVDLYTGPRQNEPGSDGIGDRPYYIRAGTYYYDQDRYPLMNPWVRPTPSVEKSSIESTFVETLLTQKAVLNNVGVSGDLNGTLSFTSFEIVSITTGSFAGKGFSKGEWQATLEGAYYKGYWTGALFFKPSERKIYLKGAMFGDLSGTLEGYLTETIPESGIYDQYQATWRIGTATTSATVNLNGTLTYESDSEFPATELYVLQTSIEGTVSGHYNNSLSVVLTHIRVLSDIPYNGEGFSIISYTSDIGAGESWTYDRLVSAGILRLKGLFTGPLFGAVSATLDETTIPRTLIIKIERVDLGLPPTADLKVKIWGPVRISPGQTTTYAIEFRNDGLKGAENVTLVMTLPYTVTYVSNTGGGVYNNRSHEVVWRLGNVPAKSWVLVTVTATVVWGLPMNTVIEPIGSAPREEIEVRIDPTVNITYETLEAAESSVKMISNVSNQSESEVLYIELYRTTVDEEIEPNFQYIEDGDEVTITFEFTMAGSSWEKIWGFIKAVKRTYDIWETAKDFNDIYVDAKKEENRLKLALDKKWIPPQDYNHFSDWYKGKSIFEAIVPNALREVRVFGPYYHTGIEMAMKGMKPIYKRQLLISMMVHDPEHAPTTIEEMDKLYLEERSHDVSSTKSVLAVARDPNFKYGPEGYVLLGQTLNYTIEYENEGEGIAFGVYFTDTLDEDLDDSTLEIGPVISTKDGSVITGPGTYNPSTRTITWLVGEVDPSEGGFANFSVKVRDDAPEDTEIINFATVYFPSVPETTRTNAIVSTVRLYIDTTSPTTLLTVGEPQYIDAMNNTYVSSTTPLTLTSEDDLGGSGVASTAYRLYNATYDSGWITYTEPFYLIALSDGVYSIDYNSTDNAENIETTNTATVILDNTPPTTTLTIGEPNFVTDMTYVTLETPFKLEANDNTGSGVYSTAYRIYNSTYDSGWLPYTAPFYLTGLADGVYTIEFSSTDNVGNVEPSNTATIILDNIGPSVTIVNPPVGWALQDGVTFTISAIDAGSGVSSLSFSIREANGGEGTPVGFDDLPATYNATTGKWTLFFDTLQLPDGYYKVLVKAEDNLGNTGFITVPYSIRNWAVIELLPASETNKAGRTMPVKFSLRVAASVDPNQPFVYNEDLTIQIYDMNDPSNILQASTFGDTARDYRIDIADELYITNFRTLKTPTTYVVEVYRKEMLIGTFEFSTAK